jgi:hypothetical protein
MTPFIEKYLRELCERTGTLRPKRPGRPAPSSTSTSPSKASRREQRDYPQARAQTCLGAEEKERRGPFHRKGPQCSPRPLPVFLRFRGRPAGFRQASLTYRRIHDQAQHGNEDLSFDHASPDTSIQRRGQVLVPACPPFSTGLGIGRAASQAG